MTDTWFTESNVSLGNTDVIRNSIFPVITDRSLTFLFSLFSFSFSLSHFLVRDGINRLHKPYTHITVRCVLCYIKPRRDVHARGVRLSSEHISTACAVTRRNVYRAAIPCKIPSNSPLFCRMILKYAKIN